MGSYAEGYLALFTGRTLPVELASFTAKSSGRNITLDWNTAGEVNNYGFYIERKDGENDIWKERGFIKGNGTVSTPKNYSYEDKNITTGKYNYRLKQTDYNGNFKYYELSNEVIVGAPSKFALSQNYPNPFNPSTSINYELPITNYVLLKVYDLTGREVMQLVNEIKPAGYYTVKFDASNLSSGMYFYKIQAGDFSSVKKMVLVK